jgi:hypothetical protein
MVESDDIGKSLNREAGAGEVVGGEAAQALRAILQTQYLRYVIIGTWALGLLTAVGLPELVTASAEEYERLAIELGRSPAQLALLKARLGAARSRCASPLVLQRLHLF